eukprot:7823970-Alexandrium_andersonii.AAC.1
MCHDAWPEPDGLPNTETESLSAILRSASHPGSSPSPEPGVLAPHPSRCDRSNPHRRPHKHPLAGPERPD